MIRTLFAGVLTLVAAAVVGSDALGRSLQKRLPIVAADLPTADGFALSAKANLLLARGMREGITAPITLSRPEKERIRRLSRAALRKEPLNDEALRNLALLAGDAGRTKEARRLMRASAEITQRNFAANMWLALDYAKLGQIDNSLAMYDQGLRSNSQAQEIVIPAMAKSLKADQMVAPVTRLLLRKPPWLADFWASAPRFTEAHRNLARIRLELAKRNVPIAPASNRILIEALAATGHFAEASELIGRLGGSGPGRQPIVRNAEFDRQPEYLPFDWQLSFNASLTSDLDSRAGVLRISMFGEGSGPAAGQLVTLPASAYRLEVRADNWAPSQRGQIYFKLRCAEAGNTGESLPIRLDRATMAVAVTKPSSSCIHNWLTIFAAPSQRTGEAVVALDRVALIAR